MSNTKQLMLAVSMYAGDHSDNFPMNTHGGEAQSGNQIGQGGSYYPWVMGWLTWDTSSHNTNRLFITSPLYSVLAQYSGGTHTIYKCPADKFLSSAQRAQGWEERVRSVSMNGAVGRGNKAATDDLLNCVKVFEKMTDATYPSPSQLWVFVDEHPDSINDGAFFNAQRNLQWIDLPGNYHNGACGFAFADGHSEIHKWSSSVSQYKVRITDFSRQTVTAGDIDHTWVLERTSEPRL
jgi:prepilin-type processing-associated H-X9-DG protein